MDSEFKIENTHVPDKVYAYMIQIHHMLYELVDCHHGDSVSIEVLDDNGVVRENGTVDAIQIKSATSERNSVSDKAVDLWKTLYNWLMSVKACEVEVENTKFRLFITVNKSGEIVSSFSKAMSTEEAEEAWEFARSKFYDENNEEKNINDAYGTYVRAFFNDDNRESAIKIIKNFHIEVCKQKYSATIREKLRGYIGQDDLFEVLYKGLLGWANDVVSECVENHRPIVVAWERFQKEYRQLFRECNQKYALPSLFCTPSTEEIEGELKKGQYYIAQLELIDAEFYDKLEAANDFLCAATDRMQWGKTGMVSSKQFKDYDIKLKRNWNNKRRIVKSENVQRTDEEKGYRLYSCCADGKVEMDNYEVPDSFYMGCMHALSDKRDIGWHPNFKKILGGKKL